MYATFAILIVTILPSLILLLHPFLLQVLAHFDLSEHWCVLKLLKLLCIQKLIPFLDSFQSCYKDNSSAELPCCCVLFSLNPTCTCCTGSSYCCYHFLVFTLPFSIKKRRGTTLDSLIFTNLSVINMLTIMAQNEEYDCRYTVTLDALQIYLYYLPMVVCI